MSTSEQTRQKFSGLETGSALHFFSIKLLPTCRVLKINGIQNSHVVETKYCRNNPYEFVHE